MDQRERQVQPPLHAARVAADLAVGGIHQADALEQRVATRPALGLGHALQRGLQPHVLATGEQRVQRGLLECRSDRAPHRGAFAHDVVPGHARSARTRRQQRGEHQHRGRLAGPVGAEEPVDLAGLDAQVDPVDRAHATLELASQALDLDAVGEERHASLDTSTPPLGEDLLALVEALDEVALERDVRAGSGRASPAATRRWSPSSVTTAGRDHEPHDQHVDQDRQAEAEADHLRDHVGLA